MSQGADPTFRPLNGGSLWRRFISAAQTVEHRILRTGCSANPCQLTEGKDRHRHNTEKPGEQLHLSMSTASFYPDDPRREGPLTILTVATKPSISEMTVQAQARAGEQQRQKRIPSQPDSTALHQRRV